jgi:hypothetical protein
MEKILRAYHPSKHLRFSQKGGIVLRLHTGKLSSIVLQQKSLDLTGLAVPTFLS